MAKLMVHKNILKMFHKLPSASSGLGIRVEAFESVSSLVDSELPVDCSLFSIASLTPGGGFFPEDLHGGDATLREALTRKGAQFVL